MTTRVYVAGHRGMVGSALVRKLQNDHSVELVLASRDELDLTNQAAVDEFFSSQKLNQVYLAAAKVGGIHANATYPADFLHENLLIQTNVMQAAFKANIDRFLFLGSSCIYPKFAPQPMQETSLLTGALEPSNDAYALAKITGIKMCDALHQQYGADFRAVMPTNLYGRNDNFEGLNSHVIPALMRRFHEAKINQDERVVVWGSGTPLREFLNVDDLAIACVYVMQLDETKYRSCAPSPTSFLNVGTGTDCSISELAQLMKEVVGFAGDIEFDTSKPDGTPRKLLDVSRMTSLGWQPTIALREGLVDTYNWFLKTDSSQLRNYAPQKNEEAGSS